MWSKNRVDSTPNTPAYSTTNTANLSAAYVSINYAYEEKTFFLEMVVYCTCAYRNWGYFYFNQWQLRKNQMVRYDIREYTSRASC